MRILYEILGAAGFLFALSMLFICIGLFKKPKIKDEPESVQYAGAVVPPGNRVFAGSERQAEDAVDEEQSAEENEDPEAEADGADDDKDLDADTDNDTAENEAEAENESEDENEDASEAGTARSGAGIDVSVTIIETNKTYNLSVTGEALIGRNPKCDVVVPKPMVSSVHCILVKDKNKLMVEDNNSTNGTLLNGKPLKHVVELKNNDMLTLGDRQIRINF